MSKLAGIRTAALAVGALGAATLAYASLVERTQFTLREFTVPVLPAGSEPITVLHLSDLHMTASQRLKQVWVSELAELEPDLVVDTGDNLGHRDGLYGIRAALEPFRGTPGVYVWGSNDYFGPSFKNPLRYFNGPSKAHKKPERLDLAALGDYLDGLGLTGLNNTAGVIEVKGVRFEFFGVDDPHRGFDRLDLMADALAEVRGAEEGLDTRPRQGSAATRPAAGAETGTVRIGVAHAPYQYVLNDVVDHGADLVFAGHTHGGQVCVPGYGALVTNCDIPREQVKGLSTWRHKGRAAALHVSAGLGTSIYAPVRFACKPEASLITLVAAGSPS